MKTLELNQMESFNGGQVEDAGACALAIGLAAITFGFGIATGGLGFLFGGYGAGKLLEIGCSGEE